MNTLSTTPQRIKSALFVDFDNIYIGLKALDEAAADRFATDPARWLAWMESGMPELESEDEAAPDTSVGRDILIRRCYLNPRDYHRYRPYFTRSAFSVIDCPPLTAQSKNSSDILMVMDITDTLDHKTRFDEFIILSGDADFTPVLLRLRAYDRRTAILTVGPAAEAYKAACDQVIGEDIFIEYGLEMMAEPSSRPAPRATPTTMPTATRQLFDSMAATLYEEASTNGEILATNLPRVYREFPEFRRDTNWLGFYSLRALTAELVRRHPELRITEGDPWRVTVVIPTIKPGAEEPRVEYAAGEALPGSSDEMLQRRIIERVRQMVAEADEPIVMAKAAHELVAEFGPVVIDSHWAGAGTFKNLLQNAADLGFAVVTRPLPGYLYAPDRHEPPTAEVEEPDADLPPDLLGFIRRISQVTGAPDLTPTQYTVLFTAISDELRKNRYNLTGTSKAVRDLCIERGQSISRGSVAFVLKGIAYAGHRFHRHPDDDSPTNLARVFRNSVLTRCHDAELELSIQDRTLLDAWILGGLPESPRLMSL